MKNSSEEWVRYILLAAMLFNLLAILFDLIDNRTFSLAILLLAGLSQLWSTWGDYQEEKKLQGRLLVSLFIRLASLGLVVTSFVN